MGYTPLRISTVKPGRELPFDLYIFFKETYLCYTNRGAAIEDEKYLKLKKQKIAKFYITEKDEPNYQRFLDQLLNETMNSPTATTDEKVNLVEGACGTAVERMQKDPESESSYRMTQNAAKSLRQVIANNPDALKKIFGKKASDADLIIKHSLNVSALATKLAEKCRLEDKEVDDIATAALIHDVGIAKLEKSEQDLFKKDKKLYSNDDKRLYNFHVKDAISVLKDKPWVTKSIIDLVINHEEVLSGHGPNKKSKLSKAEEILSLVNNYDKRLITSDKGPKAVIKDMTIDEVGNYSLELINKFKEVLEAEGLLE